jgi:hypothetical protein
MTAIPTPRPAPDDVPRIPEQRPAVDEQPFTDGETAFMQIGTTPMHQRAVLQIGDNAPIVGTYNGAGMRKAEHIDALIIEPLLVFGYPPHALDRPLIDQAATVVGDTTAGVLAEVAAERAAQDARWGEQNHPDGTGLPIYQHSARRYRENAQRYAALGAVKWRDVLLEEVYEALAESGPAALRAELVQVAAVAACWIEAIDRRQGGDAK